MCREIGAKVILPVSSAENREVLEFAKAFLGITKYSGFWLRISDEYEEGIWRDSFDKSELIGYTHWGKNEPSNSRGVEHYGMMHTYLWQMWNGIGSWNDGPSNDKQYIICEFQ